MRGASLAANKLSDKAAKAILLGWPAWSNKLWLPPQGTGNWLRAQPNATRRASNPTIASPGAKLFTTQPDALWLYFGGDEFCDAVAVEVCGTVQNLNDKRSRYIPSSHSLMVNIGKNWFAQQIAYKNGNKERWELTSVFTAAPGSDLCLPIRHLRILYSLPNAVYTSWASNHTPTGFEYYCPHSALDSYKSQKMQKFLRQMSISSQFY